MLQVHTVQDVAVLGTILGVWAHPDDETFTAGGIMTAAAANGQDVVSITATRGEAGISSGSHWEGATLGNVRQHELERALKILGAPKHHFMDYADGCCKAADCERAVQQVCHYIAAYAPDTILTFGPEGLTGHPDHCTVSSWVSQAMEKMELRPRVLHPVVNPEVYATVLRILDDRFNLFFNIDQPPLVPTEECAVAFLLPSDILERKCAALAAMPSQYDQILTLATREEVRQAFGLECFIEMTFDRKKV